MTNTIDLLESIGADASLRHASNERLAHALSGMHASEGLRLAAISGDSSHLVQELGANNVPPPNHNPHNGGCGGDGDDDAYAERPGLGNDDKSVEDAPNS